MGHGEYERISNHHDSKYDIPETHVRHCANPDRHAELRNKVATGPLNTGWNELTAPDPTQHINQITRKSPNSIFR